MLKDHDMTLMLSSLLLYDQSANVFSSTPRLELLDV